MRRFIIILLVILLRVALHAQFLMDEHGERIPRVSSFCYEYPRGFKSANLDEVIIGMVHEFFPDSKEEVKPTKLLKSFHYPENDTICISYTQNYDTNNPDKLGVFLYYWDIPERNVFLSIDVRYGEVLPYQLDDNQSSDSIYDKKIKMIYIPDRKFRGFIAKAYIKNSKVVKIEGLCRK